MGVYAMEGGRGKVKISDGQKVVHAPFEVVEDAVAQLEGLPCPSCGGEVRYSYDNKRTVRATCSHGVSATVPRGILNAAVALVRYE